MAKIHKKYTGYESSRLCSCCGVLRRKCRNKKSFIGDSQTKTNRTIVVPVPGVGSEGILDWVQPTGEGYKSGELVIHTIGEYKYLFQSQVDNNTVEPSLPEIPEWKMIGLHLGETADTAHRGDHGKAAYEHSLEEGNPHGTTAADVGAVDKSGDTMTGPLSVPLLILRDNQDTPIAEGYYARNNRPYYSNQFAVENELAFVSETLVKTTVGGMDRIIGLKEFNNGIKLGYNKFLGITNEFSMPDAATLPDAYYVFSFRHSMNSGESDITELELKFTPWSIYNSAQPNPITSGKLRIAAMTARNTFYGNRNISVIYEGEELYTPTEIIIGVRESDTSGANYAHKFIAVKANWNGAAAHSEFNPRCKIEVESFKTRITGSAYSLYYATSEALADITDFQTKIDITSYLKIIPTKDTLVQKADPDTFIELLENASPTQITEIKTLLGI